MIDRISPIRGERRRTGGRGRHRRPWWQRRFQSLRYWMLGVWGLEAGFWLLFGVGWALLDVTWVVLSNRVVRQAAG
jgi:hypothetical protein